MESPQATYFDLKGLTAYSSLSVSMLRDCINERGLPCYKLKGKILVKREDFDQWLERYRVNRKRDLDNIVDDIMGAIKGKV